MNVKLIKLSSWRFYTFLGLLMLAPSSKFPNFSLPIFDFPSFRIGLYQILLITFILLCVVPLYNAGIKFFANTNKLAFVSLVILAILSLTSVVWSLSPKRSLLLGTSILVLVLAVFTAWWYVATQINRKQKEMIVKSLLIASCIYGVLSVLELLIFTFTDNTLGMMCPGCSSTVFGFPRINGFAAEPQFFANAMLPFVFVAIYSLVKKQNKLAWLALISAVLTMGLTFSRGAFVALFVSVVFCFIFLTYKKLTNIKVSLIIFGTISLTIFASLSILVFAAMARYSNTPNIAYETVDSIAEHLTLKVINLPEIKKPEPQPAPRPTNNNQTQTDQTQFESPGLIESSSNERLGAAELAINAWRYNLQTLAFGVGAGNLGPFVIKHIDPTAPSNLTVYIYYILVIAELGIIGLLALFTPFIIAICILTKLRQLPSIIIASILLSFLIQYWFFGSYINVIYIWLWLGVAIGSANVIKANKRVIKEV